MLPPRACCFPPTHRLCPGFAASAGALKDHHETYVSTWKASRARKCPKTGQKFEKDKRTYWGVSSARRRDWPEAGVQANFHDLRRTGAECVRADGVEQRIAVVIDTRPLHIFPPIADQVLQVRIPNLMDILVP